MVDIKQLSSRYKEQCISLEDSDEIVMIENYIPIGNNDLYLGDYGLLIICTEGTVHFKYYGEEIQLNKNEMFAFRLKKSIISNIKVSPDFNCRQMWITARAFWNIDMYETKGLSDIFTMNIPKVRLSDKDAVMLGEYFHLLCQRIKDNTPYYFDNIVRSVTGAFVLEVLSLLRDENTRSKMHDDGKMASNIHGRQLVDRFMRLVEQCDGRIRKVEEYASQLNVTSKYLSVLVKDTLDRTPSEMIRFFTLKAIERRLRYTDMTMQEITYDLKFPNASFFGKYCKEHLGMTPVEYRNKYHKNVINSHPEPEQII